MSKLLAILKDSVREASSTASLWILLGIATLVIGVFFSIGFTGKTPGEALHDQVENFIVEPLIIDVGLELEEPTEVTSDDEHPEELVGGQQIAFAFTDGERNDRITGVDETLKRWHQMWPRLDRRRGIRVENNPEWQGPADAVERRDRVLAYLGDRLGRLGYEHVSVTALGDPGDLRFRVAVRTDHPEAIEGAYTLGLFFGLVTIGMDDASPAGFVHQTQQIIAGSLSFFGVLIAIFSTAFFVPRMLQKGTLDLLLARPIGRSALLVWKFLGGNLYVLLVAGYFIGGIWLALAVRSGFWDPWFLLTILTLTFKFAVLYAASVLFGVMTRSSIAALMLTYVFWFITSSIVNSRHMIQLLSGGAISFSKDGTKTEIPEWLEVASRWLYNLAPKMPDLDALNSWIIANANLPQHLVKDMERGVPEIDWFASLGSTGLWGLGLLALACWSFRRKDW